MSILSAFFSGMQAMSSGSSRVDLDVRPALQFSSCSSASFSSAALFYAIVILLTGRFSHEDDPLQLGIIQIGTLGVLSLCAAFLFETPRLPGSGAEWFCLAALVLVCTGFGFTLQPVAQKYLRSEQAGIFCALGPVSATITGALILHESITPFKLLGAALILGSILIPKEMLCRKHTSSARPAVIRSRY